MYGLAAMIKPTPRIRLGYRGKCFFERITLGESRSAAYGDFFCAADSSVSILDTSSSESRWGHQRPPACGNASQLPILRHLRQSFSTNERLTPNVAATSDWESMPVSKAAMIFSRKS